MTVSLTPPQPGSVEDYSGDVHYVLDGTGTRLDGKTVEGVALVDPATGLPMGSVTVTSLDTDHYGTPGAATAATIGTASTAVLSANAGRKLLVLCNDSANTIYVDLSGGTAALHTGVRLNAGGGSIALDRYVPTGAITAIATGSSSVLTIQEG